MKGLIEALQIFSKYLKHPTDNCVGCDHDLLFVYIPADKISEEDTSKLSDLGFYVGDDGHHFYSHKSC